MKKLYVVATPIGNLSDISKRALEVLESVQLILCEDTRHSLKLLNYYNIKNKLMSYHKFNENERCKEVLNILKDNDVAIITDAGSPCISDPGYILVKEAKENGIEVIGVGGISACITALSVSGIDSSSFTFYGFFPRDNKDKEVLIRNIKKSDIKTYIFYESPKRIIKTLRYIYESLGDVNISVSSDLTKIHEKNYFGKISRVIKDLESFENSNLGEYTFIIEKDYVEENKENSISIEAMIIDYMVKNDVTLKEAISGIKKENSALTKRDIYNASLNIKNYLI